MICKHCGREINDELSECPYCHQPTVEVEEFSFTEGADDGFKRGDLPEYCPACGAKTEAGVRYCPMCGKDLEEAESVNADDENDGAAENARKNSKLYGNSKILGVLSVILWIVSPVAGFILGLLAIHYGGKAKNTIAISLGAIGLSVSALIFIVELIVISINYIYIVNIIYNSRVAIAIQGL